MKTHLPLVAIIGRVNVGKSTLLNRLSEQHKAIVSPHPGTTRDLIQAEINWNGKNFLLVDSGGIEDMRAEDRREIPREVQKQTQQLLERADLVLFLIDGKTGVMPEDRAVARILRKSQKKLLLGVNKLDTTSQKQHIDETVWRLGFEDIAFFSAKNGTATGDLLDTITQLLPKKKEGREKSADRPKVTIIGRPNVGKSTLLNVLVGAEWSVVSAEPHTTRDSREMNVHWEKKDFIFTDTAGIRKRSKVGNLPPEEGRGKQTVKYLSQIESQSIRRALAHIPSSDVVILMLDATREIGTQDKKLAEVIASFYKPVILVVNKWDMVPEKDPGLMNRVKKRVSREFSYLPYAPVVCISALNKQHLTSLLETVTMVKEKNKMTLPHEELNACLHEFLVAHPPLRAQKLIHGQNKKPLHIEKIWQKGVRPLTFILKTPHPRDVAPGWLKSFEKTLYARFDLLGCPIKIIIQK